MKKIEQIRNKEVKCLRNYSFWISALEFIFGCAPIMVSTRENECKRLSFAFNWSKCVT